MNNEAAQLIEKLLNYYSLITMQDLAAKLNIKQSSLSSWKTRNSVNAIKKKCRELGIYNEIFGDLNIQSQNIESQNGNNSINNSGSQIQVNEQKKINNIDEVSMGLFKEAYKKAKAKDDLDDLRIYLMDYN